MVRSGQDQNMQGGDGTIWRGSAFVCPEADDAITLLHNRFTNHSRTCSNGSIIGHGLKIESGNKTVSYISQLNVTVNSNMIGRNIICEHDDHDTFIIADSVTLIKRGNHTIIVIMMV